MIGRVDDSTAARLAMQEIMQSGCIASFRHHHHEELCDPDPCCSQGRLFLLRLLPNCLLHYNCLGEMANPSAESHPTPCIIYRINTQRGEIVADLVGLDHHQRENSEFQNACRGQETAGQ